MASKQTVKKKLVSIKLPEYKDVYDAIEKANKSKNGSEFICQAVRYFLEHNTDESKMREIARQEAKREFEKLLGDYELVTKGDGEKKSIDDILTDENFESVFQSFNQDVAT